MMRAVLSKEVGGPETLVVEEIADPLPGKGQRSSSTWQRARSTTPIR